MKTFPIFFLLLFSFLHAEVLFQSVEPAEIQSLQNSMITFYAQELVQAGLFENEISAKEAALIEWGQQDIESQVFYFYLSSSDCDVRYGHLIFSIKDQIAYLEAIYLQEDYRGRGLGKQIMHRFETLLNKMGVKVVRLFVFDHNKVAVEFYTKSGYAIEATYDRNGKTIGHHMKKCLL